MSNERLNKIEDALNTVRPFLKMDGGDVEFVNIDDNQVVTLRLLGACSGCSMSQMTMKAGIEDAIKKALPEVSAVVAID